MANDNIFDTIRDNGASITEVDKDTYWYALGALPPIYGKKCFAMGEPYSFTSSGDTTYFWFTARGLHTDNEDFYACLGTQEQAEKIFQSV